MINYLKKNIITVERGVIVHGCNCSGGFGSGVAGAIRKQWPAVYTAFKSVDPRPELLGKIQIVPIDENLIVINGFTQEKFGNDGKIYADASAIRSVLEQAARITSAYQHNELYMPKVGCGLGGLDWEEDVLPIVENIANMFPGIVINVCEL